MNKIIITLLTLAAFLSATFPSTASEAMASHPVVNQAQQGRSSGFITKGQRLSVTETADIKHKAESTESVLLQDAGGAEAGTGTIVLAVIGGLVVIGAVIYAARNNNDEAE